jgi:superfamily II DNA or RNA helicase
MGGVHLLDTPIKLRAYEVDWLARIGQSTANRVLIVGPTGSGKTIIAAQAIRAAVALNQRVLFIAHRLELVEQATNKLKDVGVEVGPRVTVTTIQSLYNESPPADLIVVDEAHHAPAESYKELLKKYPKAIIYGLTATPFRCDGLPLDDLFEEIVPSAPPSQLIQAGWLSNPKIYTVPRDQRPKLLGLRRRDHDFDMASLARVTDLPELVGSVVEHYLKYAHNLPTVVYGVNIAHCEHMTTAFRHQGVRAATVYGKMPLESRVQALEMFANQELDVLVNCQLLTEGWDCPTARAAIVARPTLSAGLWFQIVGRITRPGPIQPIVLDHAGNALMHGLPLQDVEYTLKGRQINSRPDNGEKACPKCHNSVHVANRTCSWCGFEWWSPNELPEVAEGNLVLLTKRQHKRRCAWPDCPTPEKLIHSEREGAMHIKCQPLANARKYTCQYEHCLTPGKPLSQNNPWSLHLNCRMHKNGRTSKPGVRCAYEKCLTPDVIIHSRTPGVMHRACEHLVVQSQRICQYDRCPERDKLLAHKAPFQGITMHRACKARFNAYNKNPDKPRCKTCGLGHDDKLIRYPGNVYYCDKCDKLRRRRILPA